MLNLRRVNRFFLKARSVHFISTLSSPSPLNTLFPRFFYRTEAKNQFLKSAVFIGFSTNSIFDSRPQYPRYGSAVLDTFRKPKFYWQEQFLINFQWNQWLLSVTLWRQTISNKCVQSHFYLFCFNKLLTFTAIIPCSMSSSCFCQFLNTKTVLIFGIMLLFLSLLIYGLVLSHIFRIIYFQWLTIPVVLLICQFLWALN